MHTIGYDFTSIATVIFPTVMNLKPQVIPGQHTNIVPLIVLVSIAYRGGLQQGFYICCHFELDLKAYGFSVNLPLLWLQ